MAGDTYRVFLSAVSSELGAARRAVATELRARGLLVTVQEEFTQHPDTTLCKLHDYIRDCDAVVCLIGRRDGSLPPRTSAGCCASLPMTGSTQRCRHGMRGNKPLSRT